MASLLPNIELTYIHLAIIYSPAPAPTSKLNIVSYYTQNKYYLHLKRMQLSIKVHKD